MTSGTFKLEKLLLENARSGIPAEGTDKPAMISIAQSNHRAVPYNAPTEVLLRIYISQVGATGLETQEH